MPWHQDNDRRKAPSRLMRCWASPKISILLILLFVLVHRQSTLVNKLERYDDENRSKTAMVMISKRLTMIPSTRQNTTTTTTLSSSSTMTTSPVRGAIVILAGQRNAGTFWNISRFCLLRRAIRSVDEHINKHYGPYQIYVVVARDHDQDPSHVDAAYSKDDRALVASWAPHSQLVWEEVDLYSGDALEPGTTREQIIAWRNGGEGNDGAVKGSSLGYQSMCRFWSGRVQSMTFLDEIDYYMRIDDDSLLTSKPPWDPFIRMAEHSLSYAFKRYDGEQHGIDKLWMVASEHVTKNNSTSHKMSRRRFLDRFTSPDGSILEYYSGTEPYNNFHISEVGFWRSSQWQQLMEDMDDEHLFFKYRVGDANVHA